MDLIARKIQLNEVDVWVAQNEKLTIPEIGIGGSTPTGNSVNSMITKNGFLDLRKKTFSGGPVIR